MPKTLYARLPLAAALALCAAASPAAAQVQQGNPNAANQSLSNMGAARSAQQSQTSQGNAAMMNAERGSTTAPLPTTSAVPVAPQAGHRR